MSSQGLCVLIWAFVGGSVSYSWFSCTLSALAQGESGVGKVVGLNAPLGSASVQGGPAPGRGEESTSGISVRSRCGVDSCWRGCPSMLNFFHPRFLG